MFINTHGAELSEKEIAAYQERGSKKYGDTLKGIDIVVDGDEVELHYYLVNPIPFERVRRITGYLVGTMDKWNDAKRAEEKERVKHDV